jgi:hypothetical protein
MGNAGVNLNTYMKSFKQFLTESEELANQPWMVDFHKEWDKYLKKVDDIDSGIYHYPTDRNDDWRENQKEFRKSFLTLLDRDDVKADPSGNRRYQLIDTMLDLDDTLAMEPNIPFDELEMVANMQMVANPGKAKPGKRNLAGQLEARRAIEQGEALGATNPKTGQPFSYKEILELPPEEKAKIKKLEELEQDIGLEFDRGFGGFGVPNFYFQGPDRLPSNLVKRKRLGTLGVDVPSLRSLGGAGLAAAGAITGSALTQGAEAMTDVLGAYGAPPTPKDRMQIEKSFNSDTGLGFDLSPEGELEASPEGFKSVRQRQKKGINFPTMVRGQQQ